MTNEMNSPDSKSIEVGEEEIIRLLAERLVVNSNKRKVGEVTIRKEVETQIVEVPLRREKLIVEQISPEYKILAEISLGEEELPKFETVELGKRENRLSQEEISQIHALQLEKLEHEPMIADSLTVSGKFDSPKVASLLLNAIALERKHGCQQINLTITVDDPQTQARYEEWFNRTSIKSDH